MSQPVFLIPRSLMIVALLLCAIFIIQHFGPDAWSRILFEHFAFIPIRFYNSENININIIASYVSPIGYSLLHGSILHIAMNLAVLIALAKVIILIAPIRFWMLWFVGALFGVLPSLIWEPLGQVPMIGASAVVSAYMGALVVLGWLCYPTLQRLAKMLIVIVLVMNAIFAIIPAKVFGVSGTIAWQAHLSGFIGGAIWFFISYYIPWRFLKKY